MATDMMQRSDWFADPFFGAFGQPFFTGAHGANDLTSDIEESTTAYVARIEVPGHTKQDVALTYHDNVLTVAVKATAAPKGTALLAERTHDPRSRRFRLPNVAANDISATLENGVLTVTLPKLTGAAGGDHQIAID
ncbi:Hsp20/alpha crystallin family protein [Lacticaseibacillus daqingensis]|uniref:Hsp20/alpha crystallin family protein n=1 Tax=Lacticaseibacillus daqingensis TaxID=2486014 RepID=UPI000F7A8278|nr:Hsp20/alpha crystallin family protein [Lacticaseibacillus daqingensis]